MDINAEELNKLLERLLDADEQTRQSARQEIQSWSYETVLRLLTLYWPQGYDLPRPEPAARWERFRRKWSPPEEPPPVSAILDLIVIFHGEVTPDARAVGLILSVLARTAARTRKLEPVPSSPMARQIRINCILGDTPPPPLTRSTINRLLAVLNHLLPLVTPEDCSLSPKQCDALLIPLEYPYRNVDLTLNILALLALVGEKRHLPTIERVAQGAIRTDNGRRIHATSNTCLEQIRARHDKTWQAQFLLRASANKTLSTPETLLRPTCATAADPPDELLRPEARMKDEG